MTRYNIVNARWLPRDYSLPRLAQPVNTQFNHVARFQVLRWLHAESDSSRSSRADDIAPPKGHELADIAYQSRYFEDHFSRPTFFPLHPHNLSPHFKPGSITELLPP